MSSSGSGYSVEYSALSQAPQDLESVIQAISALQSLASVGAAASGAGSPAAAASMTQLGTASIATIVKLVTSVTQIGQAIQQNLSAYQSNETSTAGSMTQTDAGFGTATQPLPPTATPNPTFTTSLSGVPEVSGVADEVSRLATWGSSQEPRGSYPDGRPSGEPGE